jgi:hypothetical protein
MGCRARYNNNNNNNNIVDGYKPLGVVYMIQTFRKSPLLHSKVHITISSEFKYKCLILVQL